METLFLDEKIKVDETNSFLSRIDQKHEELSEFHEKEFDERFDGDIDRFICWYNEERISEALDYITLNKAYSSRL